MNEVSESAPPHVIIGEVEPLARLIAHPNQNFLNMLKTSITIGGGDGNAMQIIDGGIDDLGNGITHFIRTWLK